MTVKDLVIIFVDCANFPRVIILQTQISPDLSPQFRSLMPFIDPHSPLFLNGSAAGLAVGRGLVPAQEPGGRLTLHQENLSGADVPRRLAIPPPDAVLKIEFCLLPPVQQSKTNFFSLFKVSSL